MKAILLVRVSTERQSFDEQEKQLYDMAIADGYKDSEIVAIAEKESGIKLSENERKGLNKMKEVISADNSINCVYCWEISRIARKQKILYSILDYLKERKINLKVASPLFSMLNADGTVNESSEIIFSLFSTLSETEMRNKFARFARGKKANKEKGIYNGGFIPFGYKVDQETKRIIENKEESDIVRRIFAMYLSGEHSSITIAKEFQQEGIFEGTIEAIRNRISQITLKKSYCESEMYPAIISKADYDKVQEIKKNNIKQQKKVVNEYFYGKGILTDKQSNHKLTVYAISNSYGSRRDEESRAYIQANIVDNVLWWSATKYYIDNWQGTETTEKEKVEEAIKITEKKIKVNEKNYQDKIEAVDRLEERIVLGRISAERSSKLEALLDKDIETIKKEEDSLISSLNSLKMQLNSVSNKNVLDVNSLMSITDNKTRYEIIKDNVKTAYITKIKTSFYKLEVVQKTRLEKEPITLTYYINSRRSLVYSSVVIDDNGNTIFFDENEGADNQKCLIQNGIETIHTQTVTEKRKAYNKDYNKRYNELHRTEILERKRIAYQMKKQKGSL